MAKPFRAFVLDLTDGRLSSSIQELTEDALPEGDVTVAIDYSDLNYKDGMILKGLGKLVRRYPHVPGVDFAGTVERSAHPGFREGDKVVLTGWRVGETWWGGYAQKARVKGDWLIPLPEGFDSRAAMSMGTAGFTAALAVMALEEHGVTPDQGDILVTGAAGGVGSVAVALASRRGFTVVASTGRQETRPYLSELGAGRFIDRTELSEGPIRPLDSEIWAGCIDTVGSTTLGKALSQLRYHGVAAACGLAGGPDLPASVVPFLLRGVRLIGIDSVLCPLDRRRDAWSRLVEDLPREAIERMTTVEPLSALPDLAERILKGQTRGRVVIDVNA